MARYVAVLIPLCRQPVLFAVLVVGFPPLLPVLVIFSFRLGITYTDKQQGKYTDQRGNNFHALTHTPTRPHYATRILSCSGRMLALIAPAQGPGLHGPA